MGGFVAENESFDNGTSIHGGGAGVGIFASVPGAQSYGNVVINNQIRGNGHAGVAMHSHTPGQTLTDNVIVGNRISGNGADTGEAATPGPVDATENWWGCAKGPSTGGCSSVEGNGVSITPFLTSPVSRD